MKTEISKGTQKFIWHLVAFAAVFVLALVVICRVLPEPNSISTVDQNARVTTFQTEENFSTDFNSVKERVDQANNTTGKEPLFQRGQIYDAKAARNKAVFQYT